MLKSSKGITLVALVITIILLLILAGVTIKIALDTELFGKAQQAAQTYQDEADRETTELKAAIDEIKALIDKLPSASSATK